MARTTRKKTSPRRTTTSDSASPGQTPGSAGSATQPSSQPPSRTKGWQSAYPDALKEKEEALLRQRVPSRTGTATVGFALSGGGIRSATFCLGVFQGLAKLRLLKNIDYLSTVSGGGYFGSFYGRLFSRDEVKNIDYVQAILDPEHEDPRSTPMKNLGGGKVMQWLRDNGRHLSPNGSGDLLLGLAIMFRNWIAIQVVMLTALLTLCLALQWVRCVTEWGLMKTHLLTPFLRGLSHFPGGTDFLWWSPYTYLALVLVGATLVPMWAYWMVRNAASGKTEHGLDQRFDRWLANPKCGLLFTVLVAVLAFFLYGQYPLPFTEYVKPVGGPGPTIGDASLVVMALALLTLGLTSATACRVGCRDQPTHACRVEQRHMLSVILKLFLVATAAVVAFSVIDSLGQTAYLLMIDPDVNLHGWLTKGAAGTVGSLFAFAAGARKFAVSFGGSPGGHRLRLSLSLLSTLAFLVLLLFILIGADTVSHAVAWEFKTPDTSGMPTELLKPAKRSLTESQVNYQETEDAAKLSVQATISRRPDNIGVPTYSRDRLNTSLLLATAVALVLTFLFGRTWQFLNNSSLHLLYTARLVRAYLGASNPERIKDWVTVTQTLPEDDATMAAYWYPGSGSQKVGERTTSPPITATIGKGAPVHIINMTLNETVSGRSQIEQRDRKGMGFAFGPAGISAGVTHHVVLDWENVENPLPKLFPGDEDRFRVFDYKQAGGSEQERAEMPREGNYTGEELTVGEVTGISGAAFSTGLGARTHMGLSFLAAFFNVRTGYWWDSGITPKQRFQSRITKRGSSLGDMFTRCFPVVSYLIDEALARFHGPLRQRWYLSDGGHFENMGGYELIRRRLPFIVVVDAECDTDYRFEGLSNLVRKARLDFDAEIDFLSEDDLERALDDVVRPYFGTLEMLRRGSWQNEEVPSEEIGAHRRFKFKKSSSKQYSLAYAALARVIYHDEEDGTDRWLMYVKPALINAEPRDVLTYHSQNTDFPQQTTGDQFFDEAQWESYRKLGEHIARCLFQPPSGEDAKLSPHRMLTRGPQE